jgi:uncharacterized protein YggE
MRPCRFAFILPHRFATFALLAAALPLAAQQIAISKDNKTIAINTSADASALADTAVVSIGFLSYGREFDATYADATSTSNAIIAELTTSGVPKNAIQSTDQSLAPLSPDSNEDKARYAQGIRFQFSQGWQVTVAADQAARVVHLAIASGANNSGNIDWQLKNDDALQAEAAQKALQHAREVASRMAQGLGAKLGALIYASNQTPPSGIFANLGFGNLQLSTQSSAMSVRMRNLKPLAISPERITKSATVCAVFAIE